MKTLWTVNDVLAESPCLSESVIREHFGAQDTLTLRDILALPNLSDEHKVWFACRSRALRVSDYDAWKNIVLTRVITTHALTCGILCVETWAQTWIKGQNRGAARASRAARAAEAARAAWAAEAAWAAWAAGAAGAAEAAARAAVFDLAKLLHEVCD